MIHLPKVALASFAGSVLLAVAIPSGAQPTYGSQLMTPDERAEHRSAMRGLPPADRQTYRQEHHEAMRQRAQEMGASLPERPPVGPGRGMGPGAWGHGYGRGGPGYGPGGPGYGRGGRDYGRHGNRGRFRNWDRNRFRYGRGYGPDRR